MTDRAWFSRLVRHPARKQSGSILTIPEPVRGKWLAGRFILITLRLHPSDPSAGAVQDRGPGRAPTNFTPRSPSFATDTDDHNAEF